jgi:hypothetical protein
MDIKVIAYECLKLLLLGAATGAISMTVSKSKFFKPLRNYLNEFSTGFNWVARVGGFLGDLVSCPYCTSHWVAFLLTLAYFPKPLPHVWLPLDFLVSMMVVVALASFTAKWIFSIYADE